MSDNNETNSNINNTLDQPVVIDMTVMKTTFETEKQTLNDASVLNSSNDISKPLLNTHILIPKYILILMIAIIIILASFVTYLGISLQKCYNNDVV